MVLCTTPLIKPLERSRPCWMPSRPTLANNENGDCLPMNNNNDSNSQVSTSIGKRQRNVAIAYNYQVSLVDEFVGSAPPRRSSVEGVLESTGCSANTPQIDPSINDSEDQYSIYHEHTSNNSHDANSTSGDEKEGVGVSMISTARSGLPPSLARASSSVSLDNNAAPGSSVTRRSNRDTIGKRKSNLARIRVRYDMEVIPPIERNAAFLKIFGSKWWLNLNTSNEAGDPRQTSRRSTRIKVAPEQLPKQNECPPPFLEPGSVVWVPTKRSEWEDCVAEMTAVCASAEWRRREKVTSSGLVAPASAPLSRDYIKDRVDIDDPLNGFQIRHASGGWMQGFLMWTNFTTWTRNFKWDSLHPQSGIPANGEHGLVDHNGTLSRALEALPRMGDPLTSGIIFEHVAEIGLVGSLGGGCGDYLLHMALDDIRSKRKYRYVVLQATESSRGFYERYGFVRVGAICRYESNFGIASLKGASNHDAFVEEKKNEEVFAPPIVGYRHWTHANESDASLQMHGGPSYMMCLELPPLQPTESQSEGNQDSVAPSVETSAKSLMDTILSHAAVRNKPKIEPVANGVTVTILERKAAARATEPGLAHQLLSVQDPQPPAQPPACILKRSSSAVVANTSEPLTKRRKTSEAAVTVAVAKRGPGRPRTANESTPVAEVPCKSEKRKPSVPKKKPTATPAVAPTSSTTHSKKKKSAAELKEDERTYYSVRGPDGRFMRIPIGEKPPSITVMMTTTVKKKPTTPRKSSRANNGSPDVPVAKGDKARTKELPKPEVPARKITERKSNHSSHSSSKKKFNPINTAELRKQKVKAYPRDRPHFYNRVVKPIDGRADYFFVFEYKEDNGEVRLVPMEARGTLMGKREGRPRYQCCIGATDENFLTDSSEKYQVVDAHMVMKTPLVAQEAWDIEDD